MFFLSITQKERTKERCFPPDAVPKKRGAKRAPRYATLLGIRMLSEVEAPFRLVKVTAQRRGSNSRRYKYMIEVGCFNRAL